MTSYEWISTVHRRAQYGGSASLSQRKRSGAIGVGGYVLDNLPSDLNRQQEEFLRVKSAACACKLKFQEQTWNDPERTEWPDLHTRTRGGGFEKQWDYWNQQGRVQNRMDHMSCWQLQLLLVAAANNRLAWEKRATHARLTLFKSQKGYWAKIVWSEFFRTLIYVQCNNMYW